MKWKRVCSFVFILAFFISEPFLHATQDDHLPDFAVMSITDVTPLRHAEYYYEQGEVIDFDVVIRNLNYQEGDVYRNVSLWFQYPGFPQWHQDHHPIPEVRGEDVHIPFQLNTADGIISMGNNRASAVVNLSNAIPESNRDNNSMRTDPLIRIVAPGRLPDLDYGQNLPDLEITGIRNVTQGMEAPYALSDHLQFEVTLRNNNFATAPRVRNFWVYFQLGESFLNHCAVRIDEMNQEEITVAAEVFLGDGNLTLGDKQLTAIVNLGSFIPETNSDNNRRNFDPILSITQNERPLDQRPPIDSNLPDFVVTGIQNVTPVPGPRYLKGTILEFDVSVRNNNFARSGSFRGVEVRLNFEGFGVIDYIHELQETATVHYRILTDRYLALQAHPVTATIDASSNIEEAYEDNNTFRSGETIEVYDEPRYRSPRPDDYWDHHPDLVVTNVRNVTPAFQSPTQKGAILEFEATLRNQNYQPGDVLRRVPVDLHFNWDLNVSLSIDRLEQEATAHFIIDTGQDFFSIGEKRIRVTVNEQNGIQETNSQNNTFEMPERINLVIRQNPVIKDIFLESIRFDPPNAQRGDLVHAVYRVSNQGTDATGLFYITGHLNNDTEIAGRVDNLNPGQTLEQPMGPALHAGFGNAVDTLTAIADEGQYIAESNEENNTQSTQVNYPFPNQNAQDRAAQTVDLFVRNIRRAPVNFNVGGIYEINQNDVTRWEVILGDNDFRDLAQAQHLENVEVALEIGNVRLAQTVTVGNGLAAATFEIPGGQIGLGDFTIRASVDTSNRIQESNENNNTYEHSTPLSIVPQGAFEPIPTPDIVMESATINPPNPHRGDRVSPIFHLRNDGNKRTGPFYVSAFKDDNDWSGFLVENLNPGQGIDGRFDSSFLANTQSIRVTADPYRYIFESNEDNNSVRFSLDLANPNIGGGANSKDLYVFSIKKNPRNVVNEWREYELNVGEEIELVVTVLDNDSIDRGNETRLNNVEVVLHAGAWSQSQTITLVNGMAEVIYRIPGATLGQGTHALSAEVDPGRRIQESNEGNNRYETRSSIAVLDHGALVPTPFADLAITGFTVDPPDPRAGEPMMATLELVNQGDVRSGVFNVKITNPNILLGSNPDGTSQYREYPKQVQSLEPGEHIALRFDEDAISPRRAGRYQLSAQADYTERVLEYEERNNSYFATFNVAPHAGSDLQMASFQLANGFTGNAIDHAHAGERVRYSVLVINNGADAVHGYTVKFWPYANAEPLVRQKIGVTPYDGFDVFYFDDVRYPDQGNQTARAMIDPDNQVNEYDETNNQAEMPISILAAQPAPRNAQRPVITTPVYAWDHTIRGTIDANFNRLSDYLPMLGLYTFDKNGMFNSMPTPGGVARPQDVAFGIPAPTLVAGQKLFVVHKERDPQTGEILSVESATTDVLPRNDYTSPTIQEPLLEGDRLVQGTCDGRWRNGQMTLYFMTPNETPAAGALARTPCQNGRFAANLNLALWQGDQIVAEFSGGINDQGVNIVRDNSQVVTIGAPSGEAVDRRLPEAGDFDAPRIVGPVSAWQRNIQVAIDPDFDHLSEHSPMLEAYYLDVNHNRRRIATTGSSFNGNTCSLEGVNMDLTPGREIFVIQNERIPRTDQILSIESPHEQIQPRADYHEVVLQGPIENGDRQVHGTYDGTTHGASVNICTLNRDNLCEAAFIGSSLNLQGGRFNINLDRALRGGERVAAIFSGTTNTDTYIAMDYSAPVLVRAALVSQNSFQNQNNALKQLGSAEPANKLLSKLTKEEAKKTAKPAPKLKKKKSQAGFFKRLFVDDPIEAGEKKGYDWKPEPNAKRSKAEEQALLKIESGIPKAFIEDLAKQALRSLFEAYARKDLNGFMHLVSEEFTSVDGKRAVDLYSSLVTDFEELNNPVLTLRSINQVSTRTYKSWLVTIGADWNRNANVEIGFQQKRWQFEGRSEFTFHVELNGNLSPLVLQNPKAADYHSLDWKARLHELRGDKIFGLTDLEGVLRVEPAQAGRRSTLDGQRVVFPVIIGRTGQGRIESSGAALQNQTATFSSGSVQTESLDFSTGNVSSTAIPGAVVQGDVFMNSVGDLEAVGAAQIESLPAVNSGNFNAYTKDTEPGQTTAAFSTGDAFLVRTQQGKYAKFLVTSKIGSISPISTTLKYAFQQDGSGNLASRD